MASSDTLSNPDKDDEQVPAAGSFLPVNNTRNIETVKPPPSSGSGNKRKRESAMADHSVNTTNEETKPNTAGTKQTETTTVVKEVEMKDAESVEIEMHDVAEVAYNKSVVRGKEYKRQPNGDLNASEGVKKDEENVERSEKSVDQKQSNDEEGSGQQHVLGEVATLLKQVEESDTKAKLEVEVKVKKLDHGDVKENIGQVTKEPNLGPG